MAVAIFLQPNLFSTVSIIIIIIARSIWSNQNYGSLSEWKLQFFKKKDKIAKIKQYEKVENPKKMIEQLREIWRRVWLLNVNVKLNEILYIRNIEYYYSIWLPNVYEN